MGSDDEEYFWFVGKQTTTHQSEVPADSGIYCGTRLSQGHADSTEARLVRFFTRRR